MQAVRHLTIDVLGWTQCVLLCRKSGLRYVGDTADFSKNTGTTIYGMTAQYWESVVVGFENRLVTQDLLSHNIRLQRYCSVGGKLLEATTI